MPPAAAPRPSPSKNPPAGREGDDEEVEKNIWMDPDALSVDCGICFMPFECEVFMVSIVACNTSSLGTAATTIFGLYLHGLQHWFV